MSSPQHLECDTPDCSHRDGGACVKPTAVTIQDHHCVDYEPAPARSIAIVVEGGMVTSVYAAQDLAGVCVEVLDLDAAKVSSNEERTNTGRHIHKVARTCTQIY